MPNATVKRPKALVLREERAQGFAPLAAGKSRVDAAAGIIYGVKVVGRSSPNSHGMNATGTDYTLAALTAAVPLYEGAKVNINHPKKGTRDDRDSHDRIGKLANCRIEDGEIYADLHLLTSHPMTSRLVEAAEKMPDAFALSHNALGKGEVVDGRYVISEIPEVRSVDVVSDGGTNRSLFEGLETADLLEEWSDAARKAAAASRKAHAATTATDKADAGSGHNFKAHEYSHKANNAVDAGDSDVHHNAGFHHEEAAKRHEAAARDYKGGWFSKGDKEKFAAHTAAAAAHREAAAAHKQADRSKVSESYEGIPMKTSLAALLESKPTLKPKYAPLLKAWPAAGEKLLLEADEEAGDYRDHLHAAKKMCEDAGDYDTAKKIHGLMKPIDESAEDEGKDPADSPDGKKNEDEKEEAVEESGSDEIRGKNQGGQKRAMWAKDPENPYAESRQFKPSKDPAVRALQEQVHRLTAQKARADLELHVRQLCEARDLPCDKPLLESCLVIADRKQIAAHLDWLKGQGVRAKTGRNGSAPRSSSPVRPVQESAAPKNVDEFVAVLLR